MKLSGIKGILAGLTLAMSATSANATLLFSDIVLTSRSISFTVDGDMTGYVPSAGSNLRQFSILFSGDFWTGALGDYSSNTWSTSLFDNKSISFAGNTGWFNGATTPYTWVYMNSNLTNAFANNRSVTVDFGDDYLDVNESGTLEFFWGNGYTTSTKTSLQVSAADPISSPSSIALLMASLVGLCGLLRRQVKLRKQAETATVAVA
ncbi:MAG: hypothetical protein AB8B48_04695 [Pseudomonadales bacterium]